MQWAYGVTTVPERVDSGVLWKTLESLRNGGFDSPRLFMDGQSTPGWEYQLGDYDQTSHQPKIGAYNNWYLALVELFMRQPEAERYAIFQDDLICVKNLRQYLESERFPEKSYLNLYTIPKNEPAHLASHKCNQWCSPHHGGWGLRRALPTRFYPSDQTGAGAVALVFDHAGAKFLIGNRHMTWDIDGHPVRRNVYIDGRVAESFRREGWVEYVHSPSLVQHVGEVSTMGDATYSHVLNPGYGESASFPGEQFDATSLV